MYEHLNGDYWFRNDNWRKDVECKFPDSNGTQIDFPSHCCWFGIKCCTHLSNLRQKSSCPEKSVREIVLPLNNITGTIPEADFEEWSLSLEKLVLHSNAISGTIPRTFNNLVKLKLLSLNDNKLEGTIPLSSNMSSIQDVSLAYNSLNGTVPGDLFKLRSIEFLQLGNNQLRGTIPPCRVWGHNISNILLENNHITGRLPFENDIDCDNFDNGHELLLNLTGGTEDNLTEAYEKLKRKYYRALRILNLRNNNITGTISACMVYQVPLLQILDFGDNKLEGSVPRQFSEFQLLQQFSMGSNNLTGPLVKLPDNPMNAIKVVDLGGNAFTGTIPQFYTSLVALDFLILASNNLNGTVPNNLGKFAEYISLNDNIRLNSHHYRNSLGQPLPESMQFDENGEKVPVTDHAEMTCVRITARNHSDTIVNISPTYTNYTNCTCRPEYREEREISEITGFEVMECVLIVEPGTRVWLVLVIALPVIVVLTILHTCWRFRYEIRELTANLKKRAGPPKMGDPITMVVTDVEGSTELWEWDDRAMNEALELHDRLLRQTLAQNYGYEITTEGDSFIVAFHDPIDAVRWCLQVQLALMECQWSEDLLGHRLARVEWLSIPPLKKQSSRTVWRTVTQTSSAVKSWYQRMKAKKQFKNRQTRFSLKNQAFSGDVFSSELLEAASGAVLQTGSGSIGLPEAASAILKEMDIPAVMVFRGLRVRMGIATGIVTKLVRHEITKRMIYYGDTRKLCSAVSDLPSGGQILMDGVTFGKIRFKLLELGAVDSNGVNSKMLRQYRALNQRYHNIIAAQGGIIMEKTKSRSHYKMLQKQVHRRCAPFRRWFRSHILILPVVDWEDDLEGMYSKQAVAIDMGYHFVSQEPLRLVQILPPALASRANFFHPINSKQQLMDTFFQAPGCRKIVVGCPSSVLYKLIDAPVMLVYCQMCNDSVFKKELSYEVAQQVYQIYHTVLFATAQALRAYVSGVQEGDIMLVFRRADKALEWCILMQHSLMDAQWPPELLQLKNFKSVRSPTGEIVFKGPRVKITVCAGIPQAIQPHPITGRADYTGSAVSRSARLCLWCCSEGQIITTKNIAEQAFIKWNEKLVKYQQQAQQQRQQQNDSVNSNQQNCHDNEIQVDDSQLIQSIKIQLEILQNKNSSNHSSNKDDINNQEAEVKVKVLYKYNTPNKFMLTGCQQQQGQVVQIYSRDVGIYQLKGVSEQFHLIQIESDRMVGRKLTKIGQRNKTVCLRDRNVDFMSSFVCLPECQSDLINLSQLT